MSKNEKSRWAGLVLGPGVAAVAVMGLWKNETRFDYHRAASKTTEIKTTDAAVEDESFSISGPMDQDLTIDGKYVNSFTGYLAVWRYAEIYAWDRDKKDDRVTWNRKWMSSVESNSRNKGITQKLSAGELYPPQYHVGSLVVDKESIEFVDSDVDINPTKLTLSELGKKQKLSPQSEYLYLSKHQSDNLGDERLSYIGIPIPSTATYFGKFSSGRGVADESHRRTGFVNSIIKDTGILHHIVAGDRTVALATMKSHIQRLKWIIRSIGTAGTVLGFFMLFATILGFLFHIPLIGAIAEYGSFLLAMVIGVPIAIVTIVSSYLIAHPLILAIIITSIAAGLYFIRKRGMSSQQTLKNQLAVECGHEVGASKLKDLEFIELAQLALADSDYNEKEEKFLLKWAKKHGWSSEKYDDMLLQAISSHETNTVSADGHLQNLVRLAMADGNLSSYEIRSIRAAGKRSGFDDKTVSQLISHVRRNLNEQRNNA